MGQKTSQKTNNCPDGVLLRRLHDGRLAEDELDRWSQHVEHCDFCAAALESLRKAPLPTDLFVGKTNAPRVRFDPSANIRTRPPVGSIDELIHEIDRAGLLPAREVRATLRVDETQHLTGPQEAARTLVLAGKLTNYQAEKVLKGVGQNLRVGNYFLTDRIGSGGMGRVYKALDPLKNRVVALKILRQTVAFTTGVVERFRREGNVCCSLQHDHIVSAYEVNQCRDLHYLAMEFVDGWSLEQLLQVDGLMAITAAVGYIGQAAQGLDYAHSRGVIHRDIKPPNLLLSSTGCLKIADFGLARVLTPPTDAGDQEDVRLTHSSDVFGTPEYMAPEQLVSSAAVDHRADIYSLGCTLYRCLTRELPVPRELCARRSQSSSPYPIASARARRSSIPEPLDRLVMSMLAFAPDDRPQTAQQVVDELSAVVA